jgi:hypothetical protein
MAVFDTYTQYVPEGFDGKPYAGCLILTNGDNLVNKTVYWGQRLVALTEGWPLKDRQDFCHYDHVAMVVGKMATLQHPEGEMCVVEALPGGWVDPRDGKKKRGARVTPLSRFTDREYHIIHPPTGTDQDDIDEAVDYALSIVGWNYGLVGHYMGMVASSFSRISIVFEQQEICSSAAAKFLTRMGVIWDRSEATVKPADIAKMANVRPRRGNDQLVPGGPVVSMTEQETEHRNGVH